MNCQICGVESVEKYCDECKHIRCVYVIHKLNEIISLNENFNTNTLIIRKLKNIEQYDLELLAANGILTKDRLNNYKWSDVDKINKYLESYDKSNSKLTFREESKKEEKMPTSDEVVLYIEKNYNMTDMITHEKISSQFNTNKTQTKKIIQELEDNNIIKKSFYDNYRINYHQIIKFKEKNNINEDKIKTLKKIKRTPQKTKITKETKSKKTTSNKSGKKTNKKSSEQKDSLTKKQTIISNNHLNKDDKIIPLLRQFINAWLIILPRGVKDSDLTQEDIYREFKSYSENAVSKDDFDSYFSRIINTYPHIRHEKIDDEIKYNIKSRKTPQIILDEIQSDNNKFRYNKNSQVQLRENKLEVNAVIYNDELAQLYNLLVYTKENILECNYKSDDDRIRVHIIYDLERENPDLWIKFLKSYNIYSD